MGVDVIFYVGIAFVLVFIIVIIAVVRLDWKLREDHLKLSAVLKSDKPYMPILTIKEVNDKFQIMIDGRLLSTYLMDRGDAIPEGWAAPVRLKNTTNQLKVLELADMFNVWLPCLSAPDDIGEYSIYAYVEEKETHIEWSKFAYDEGRGGEINAPSAKFDKGNYKLFVQQFTRIAEEAVNKY
jgi:hypothetical protein